MRTIGEGMLESSRCPVCGTEIQADRRFTKWCPACDWNVDPGGPEEKKGRLETLRRTLAQRHSEKLLTTMGTTTAEAQRTRRAHRDMYGLLAYVVALLVHGVTAVLVPTGVWCVVSGWGGFLMVPGLYLLLLGWVLHPRLNRLPKEDDDGVVLRRPDAPELFALIDEIAEASGTRSVDVVAVNADTNASVRTYGLRGRRLTLGLPLWESLNPEQRIALLAHELGHYGNGDPRRGLVLATAYHSLGLCLHHGSPVANPKTAVQMITNLACVVPRLFVQGVLMLLDILTLRATQRSEYLADSAAARVGSTDAAVGLMDRLLVTDSIRLTLRREVNNRRMRRSASTGGTEGDGLWEELAAHTDSIPEFEYERQRRVGALRGHSVDATHPPTHLRRRRLLDVGAVPAVVRADEERSARIAGELAGARGTVAREVVRDGVDGV